MTVRQVRLHRPWSTLEEVHGLGCSVESRLTLLTDTGRGVSTDISLELNASPLTPKDAASLIVERPTDLSMLAPPRSSHRRRGRVR